VGAKLFLFVFILTAEYTATDFTEYDRMIENRERYGLFVTCYCHL